MNINELFVETKLPEPLSTDELYNCFEKMKQGDMEARDKIINHNIKYVIDLVTRKYSNTSYDLKELVSVGLSCLVDCVDKFNTIESLYFATYLNNSISNKILNFINKEKKYIDVISLNQSIETDKEGKVLKVGDTLSDIVVAYENNELYKMIKKVVEELPEREKYVVMKYFGFEDNKSITQREIADELSLPQSNVSKIIKIGLKNIKNKLDVLEKIKTEMCYEYNESEIAEMLSMLSIIKIYNNKTYEIIINVIETLPERDKYTVMKYFDFMDNKKVTMQEIADELDISKQMVSKIIKIGLKNIKNKLDVLEKIKTEMCYEYNESEIGEMLPMLSIIKIYNNKTYEIIINVIETLLERDKYTVMKYFDFMDNKKVTMQEIADELGISKQRVAQIIDNVLFKISTQLQKQEKHQNQNVLIKNKNTNTK